MSSYSIGTDIGGTFTDCAVTDPQGRIVIGKSPSTPGNFSQGFFGAVENAASKLGLSLGELLSQAHSLVHATTAATNAMVQRTGADVGLLTTRGHAESILVMRGGGRSKGLEVDELLDLAGTVKPEPIVPRSRISEVAERIDCRGDVVVALDEDDVRRAVRELLDAGAATIAIGFLWSHVNPEHERRAREIVQELAPGMYVSCSHEVAPRMGEYYRLVATVMNAYVGPLMTDYVGDIASRAVALGYERPVLFAQCTGGMAPVDEVQRRPLFTLDSGPVSGLVASNFIGSAFGYDNIITADMGGTTFDVAVIADNAPRRRESTNINRYEMYIPMLDVESIGAGGGSIAWIDPASRTMKVGPRSAGADPGPICYGKGGTMPTVTDADAVLGITDPSRFLPTSGDAALRAAREAIGALGAQIGLSVEETASGISEIVDQMMAEKIRRMTVYRGHDPRDFVVFAFGGASPAHAGAFSRELGVRSVIVPIGNIASALSAMGTVSGDVSHIYDRSMRVFAPFDMDALETELVALERQGAEQLTAEGFAAGDVAFRRTASMKYGAQVFDVEVPLEAGDDSDTIVERFESMYEQRFGPDSGFAPAGIEIIRVRVDAFGRLARPSLGEVADDGEAARPVAERDVYWRELGERVPTPIHDRVGREPITGPAVIELPDTTVAVRPGQQIAADAHGNLVLTFD